jgi:prolyl oligopeptidase
LASSAGASGDPHRWLEEVRSERALDWVRARNAATERALAGSKTFDALFSDALSALDAEGRIPELEQRGDHVYDLWQDEAHPRGIWRRTPVDELRAAPARWETILDIDALAEREGVKWTFKGASCLPPEHARCLVRLSPEGGDAVEVRELVMDTRTFVDPEAGGFHLPEAKTDVAWIDADTIFVATDFGEGSLTTSGYPRVVKIWRRGTPLAEAETVLETDPESIAVGPRRYFGDPPVDIVTESLTYWTHRYHQWLDGALVPLSLPEDAVVADRYRDGLLVQVKSDWTIGAETYPVGAVVFARLDALRAGEGGHEVVVAPTDTTTIEEVAATRAGVLVRLLDDVRGRLRVHRRGPDGRWTSERLPLPDTGALEIMSAGDDRATAFVTYEGFLTPTTLYLAHTETAQVERLRQQAATFAAELFEVEQHFATSADGTRVPYFQVARKDMERDGSNPTHIFSYGGFRNSLTPSYSGSYEDLSGAYGKLWLERGGVFVLANIRGGGEYGPAWHRAALKADRERAFEDFEAVAGDLVARGVTSPEHLGIEGRSNGGLLVAATMLRRPDLYGAVICGVPLLDMKRYHRLFAGASWMGEYGNPDVPEEWAFISRYSPYQNVPEDAELPPIFMYTSTADDRVHPGHARKMTARLRARGHEALYYENLEGGHGGSSTHEQLAYRLALAYAFLWDQLE